MVGSTEKQEYSIWALPSEDVLVRVKKLMASLQAEFGGPEFEPHLTIIGAIWQTEDEVHKKFNAAVEGLKPVDVSSEALVYGPSFWTCLYDKITYSSEVTVEINRPTLSLLAIPHVSHPATMSQNLENDVGRPTIVRV